MSDLNENKQSSEDAGGGGSGGEGAAGAPVLGWHRALYLFAAAFTGVLIATGGVVCMTSSSSGCPDWPLCYGRLVPPAQMKSIIEWSHRTVAAFALPLLLVGAVLGWRRFGRRWWWLGRAPVFAIGFLLAVAGFGAWGAFWGLPRPAAAADLGCALVTLGLVVVTAVVAGARRRSPGLPSGPGWPRGAGADARLARLGAWSVLALWVLFVSGVLAAEKGAVARCFSLPFFGPEPSDALFRWLSRGRLALGAGVSALLVVLIGRAWRVAPRLAASVAALLIAELAVGVWLTARGLTDLVLVAYVILAAGLWASLVALAATLALPRASRIC